MSKKLVVDAEWLANAFREICYTFNENGTCDMNCLDCVPGNAVNIHPLTPAQERLLDGTTAELVERMEEVLRLVAMDKYTKPKRRRDILAILANIHRGKVVADAQR